MGHVKLIGPNLAREEHLGMELGFIVERVSPEVSVEQREFFHCCLGFRFSLYFC